MDALTLEKRWADKYLHRRLEYAERANAEWIKLVREAEFRGTPAFSLVSSPSDYATLIAATLNHLDPEPSEKISERSPDFEKNYEARCRRVFTGMKIIVPGSCFGGLVDFFNSHGAEAKGIERNPVAAMVSNRLGAPAIQQPIEDVNPDKVVKANLIVSHEFTDPDYWNHQFWDNKQGLDPFMQKVADKLFELLEKGGSTIRAVLQVGNQGSTLTEEHLKKAGFRVIKHCIELGTHISIARKPK
ncbi:hypothetical protein HZC09_03255 [Candidatus Micrarchaeota archaeon]|nr:hypothetical protein [Candidatus Micrarchaeota archaeon]